MTPWHGAVVRGVNGSVSVSHAILIPAMTHDIVYAGGHPSYFRERSDLFDWPDLDVKFEFLYPCGIIIMPTSLTSNYSLSMVDMQKVGTIAVYCSPIILRGFVDGRDCHLNIPVHAHSAVKSSTAKHGAMNQEDSTSSAPQSQYSVLELPAQSNSDYTLFASSDLLTRYLPQAYPISKLEKIRWEYRCNRPCHRGTGNIPLVVRHPIRNSPCIRWPCPWQISEDIADISIENGSKGLIRLINGLLADRRVCLRFLGQEGDIAVVDNFTMLHTVPTLSGFDLISSP